MLADATGDSRPRRASDADDPGIPVAATVVILRDAPRGPEVLMIERPDRGSFAGAWVFPGGKVDPGDAGDPDAGDPGGGDPTGAEEATARRAAVRETREEVGLVLAPDDLDVLSRWDPPPGLPLRIRTWFFAARATDAELALSPDEAVAAEWMRPADVLARHGGGGLTLYPPTWVTLHAIAGQRDVETVLSLIRLRGLERFDSVARRGADGPILLWQGDDEHDPDAGATASARHRLELGALPWRYTREP